MARSRSFKDGLAAETSKSQTKYDLNYWRSQLEGARNEQEQRKFNEHAKRSIEIFEAKKFLDDENKRKLNVWWSVVSTLLPAYYSRPPKIEGTLRKKSGDQRHNLAAMVLERGVQHQVDEEFDFDTTAYDAVLSWQLVGRGVLWANYSASTDKKRIKYGLTKGEGGAYQYADGEPYEEQHGALQTSDTGEAFVEEDVDTVTDERAYLEVPHWTDYRECVARRPDDVEWKAKRGWLSREEADELLGDDLAGKLSYDALPEQIGKHNRAEENVDRRAEVWEVWCRESDKRYFYSPSGKEKGGICEPADISLRYSKFWPCVTLGANRSLDTTIPVSDFAELKDTLLEIERLNTRIHGVVQAIRVNAAYDGSLGEDIEKIFTGDLKFVPVKWLQAKGEQALDRSIMWTPIDKLVNALTVLMDSREAALSKLYEQTGATDLMRGMVDPDETATASELKQSNTNLRFRFRQAQVHKFISGGVSLLTDIVSTQFNEQTLFQIANASELMQAVALPQGANPQMLWQETINLIRDTDDRVYRIEVATDSMLALDEIKERKDRTDLLESVGSFIGRMQPMLAMYPSITPLLVQLTKYACDSYKAGKELRDVFQQMTGQIGQDAQMQRQAMQNQAEQKSGVAEAQAKIQAAQMEASIKTQQLQFDGQKHGAEMQMKQAELNLKAQQMQIDAQIAAQKIQADAATKNSDQAVKLREADLKAAVEATKAQIEMLHAKLAAQEQILEQKRIGLEAIHKHHELAMTAENAKMDAAHKARELASRSEAKPEPKHDKPAPAPVINVHISGKRKVTRDANGKVTGVEDL